MSLNHRHAYNMEIRNWIFGAIAKSHRLAQGQLIRRPCPVCGSERLRPFVHNGALSYDRCDECALVFLNPTLPDDAVNEGFEGGDPLLQDYFDIASRYKGGIPSRPDPASHDKLKDIHAAKPAGRLLDVGCSVGDFLHLAKHFYEVEGLEINPVTAKIAGQSFTVHKDYLDRLALPPVYDVVTLHQILYGVPDPLSLLRDIRSVLKDDGILYVNTPNADSYATRQYGGRCCHFYGYTSLNVFSPKAIHALAERAGLRVLSLRTEWLDIYTPDLMEFHDQSDSFIHKRNCHRTGYEEQLAAEDKLHRQHYPDLGEGGNYLVALLGKA